MQLPLQLWTCDVGAYKTSTLQKMQAEDGSAIMSSAMAKRQRLDTPDAAQQEAGSKHNDTAYMQVFNTCTFLMPTDPEYATEA